MITSEQKNVLRQLLTQLPLEEVLGEMRLTVDSELNEVRRTKELADEESPLWMQLRRAEVKLQQVSHHLALLHGNFVYENYTKVGLNIPVSPKNPQLSLGL